MTVPVRLADVSRRAGVSTATTSRVLNGKGFVSEELRLRVLSAVEEMRYIPNGLARSMSLRRTHSLGLVVSDVTNPFFTVLARGVEDVGQERGYSVVLCNSDSKQEKERAYLEMLHEKRVDGILVSPNGADPNPVERILQAGIGVVLVDRVLAGVRASSVSADNFAGARSAAEYLLTLGHRRIGVIAGRLGASTGEERLNGFQAAMNDLGVAIDSSLVIRGDFTEDGGNQAAIQLYSQTPRPSAVISLNNLMTTGALFALRTVGCGIPDDLSLLSFDDLPLFSLLAHPLTVVAQPAYDMGRVACRLLIDQLEGIGTTHRQVRLATSLLIRESCCSPQRPAIS
jgi:LacI family transcriptional regulator